MMYRTGVVQKRQGVSCISCTLSCSTLNGKERRHSVQVITIKGTPFESFPLRGIQTGADCRRWLVARTAADSINSARVRRRIPGSCCPLG